MGGLRPLQIGVFAALVAATIGAFFFSQHLKVTDPLYNGTPRPDPPAINPVAGRVCVDRVGKRVSFRRTALSFFLQSRSDTANVYVVDGEGDIVANANPPSRYMVRNQRESFTWDGRESSGSVAPDGTYYFRIALPSANRTFTLTTTPVQVITGRPRPLVKEVSPPLISPPGQPVTIHFRAARYRAEFVWIYRTDLAGTPKVVAHFRVGSRSGHATWDGTIGGRPAPPGTYLVGLFATDDACNVGRFPVVNPPVPGSTPHTGVTVRYLAAQPPLAPVPAGSTATVFVDSRRRAYTWGLTRTDMRRLWGHGGVSATQASSGSAVGLGVKLPPLGAGLYELSITAGAHHTVVPVIASAAGRRAAARVLVVVPALSWQGENPVDDDGDGLPNTLAAGDRIAVLRPLAGGLPAAFGDEAALLAFLDRRALPYQLTTDVALAEGFGPGLAGHTGVILDGSFSWVPPSLAAQLKTFATGGGTVLSLGVHSLEATAPIGQAALGGSTRLVAGPPSAQPHDVDPFGATHGAVAPTGNSLVTVISDPLSIFGQTSGTFSGYGTTQTITPPSGAVASAAGTTNGTPSVIGFHLGHGTVIEVGLPGFAQSLYGNFDAQELVARVWQLLHR